MAKNTETYAIGFWGERGSGISVVLNDDNSMSLIVTDKTSGSNTRTAVVRLTTDRLHALAEVLEAAGEERGKIQETMETVNLVVSGSLSARIVDA